MQIGILTNKNGGIEIGSPLSVPLSSTSWTQYNVSTATVTDSSTGLAISAPSNGAAFLLQGVERTVTSGFDIRAKMAHNSGINGSATAGLYIRDATNKAVSIGVQYASASNNTGIVVVHYSSATTTVGSFYKPYYGMPYANIYWRIQDDGTNHNYYVSSEGTQWVLVDSHLKAVNIGIPVAAGIFVDAYGDSAACVLQACSGF